MNNRIVVLQFIFIIVTFFALNSPGNPGTEPFVGYEEHRFMKFRLDEGVYQIILDVEDPCFEFLSGTWNLDKNGTYWGYYYYSIPGPGTGAARGRWVAEGLPAGSYTIECFFNNDNYPQDAQYHIITTDTETTVTLDMNYVTTGWHSLGTYAIRRTCVVEVSDYWTGAGSKMSVDALRLTMTTPPPTPPTSALKPRIGICIDDCGSVDPTNPSTPIYKMLQLPYEMTYAVMPLRSYTTQTATEIHAHDSEVILHQPMAAITVPNPGAGGITDSMTLEQVRATIEANLDALPYVVGMNNHMGSLITQQRDKMQVCIEELEERHLYFYDSRTITTSVGYDVAQENGLLTGERDLFIDGNSKEEAKQIIRNLALRALYAPHVPNLGIGHVRSDTADALTEMVPELQAMGVDIVPISQCISQVVEVDFHPSGAHTTTSGAWQNDMHDRYSKQLRDGISLFCINNAGSNNQSVTFSPYLPLDGYYDIYVTWEDESASASLVRAIISHNSGNTETDIDQAAIFQDWIYLGRYACNQGDSTSVTLHNYNCTEALEIFRADAAKYVYAEPLSESRVSWLFY